MPTEMGEKGEVVVGGCYCGQVRYQSTEPAFGLTFCYCTTCQLLHGAPFAAWTNVPKLGLTWIEDKGLVEASFSDLATRTFCSNCHAPITMAFHAVPDEIGIVAATISQEQSKKAVPALQRHIFVSEKPSWYRILDSLEQHQGFPDDMKDQISGKTGDWTAGMVL